MNELPNNKIRVFYIDYGNLDIIDRKDTCVLPEEMWALPPQAWPLKKAGTYWNIFNFKHRPLNKHSL